MYGFIRVSICAVAHKPGPPPALVVCSVSSQVVLYLDAYVNVVFNNQIYEVLLKISQPSASLAQAQAQLTTTAAGRQTTLSFYIIFRLKIFCGEFVLFKSIKFGLKSILRSALRI